MLGIIISFIILLLLAIIYRALDWLPAIMGIVLKVIGIFFAIYLIVAVVFIILEKV